MQHNAAFQFFDNFHFLVLQNKDPNKEDQASRLELRDFEVRSQSL